MVQGPLKTMGLAAVLLAGCGDVLLDANGLDELFGLGVPPTDPAWEFRWLTEEALEVDCALVDADILDDEPVFWGELSTPVPDVPEPLAITGKPPATYALGLPVLVDRELYEPLADDAEPDESLHRERGVWGIAEGIAALVVDGDAEAVRSSLFLEDDVPELTGEVTWVALLPEVIDSLGVEGSLLYLDDHDRQLLYDDGLWVLSMEEAPEGLFELWSGVSSDALVGCD
ncbi:MAG: hypothetical protein KTR31_22520 [Myxococcales bacterium]|nr:hypothetical protein [Myxococcales bacterium]